LNSIRSESDSQKCTLIASWSFFAIHECQNMIDHYMNELKIESYKPIYCGW
jgi:hypothetical protein